MAQTPIYEQYARNRNSIRSIQPVQQSPQREQNKHSISLISSTPIESSYSHAHPYEDQSSRQLPTPRERDRPQSQYYQHQQSPTRNTTDLKHSRSQSNALFSIRRKEPENAPKRAQSVLFQQQQHVRVSQGSDTSVQSEVSTNADQYSNYTSETSASAYASQQQRQQPAKSGYSHHAAVRDAVGYAPQQPAVEEAAFSKKIVVVGDGGSGKTSLLMRYKERIFPDKYVPTVFENYITNKHHRGTNKTVEVALWDTAGQEEYDRLRPLSYPETSIILICFAIDCPQSLDSVKEKWYPEVAHFCPDTPVLLVACKSDLRDNASCIDLLEGQGLRPTTVDEGRAMAKFIGSEAYIECSSKNMVNVDETFEAAIDVSIAHETGTDWSQGQVGQELRTGRMGNASQALKKPESSGRATGGFSNGGGVFAGAGSAGKNTGGGGGKKKGKKEKSRACKVL